jgi:hypothetical protein
MLFKYIKLKLGLASGLADENEGVSLFPLTCV